MLTLACFAPVLRQGFVVWDDELNFTLNLYYRGLSWSHLRWMFTTFLLGHYQPLSWMTLGLDYTLWGMDGRGYHLTNLVLHGTSAVLFYLLSLRLLRLGCGRPGAPEPDSLGLRAAAAASALLFAIHPLRVESVAWLSERRDVLSGVFFLATLLAYLRMQATPRRSASWWRWYAAALVCLVLSLLSKAWGMTLPVVLLALDFYPLRRGSNGERLPTLILEKIPFIVCAAGAAVLAVVAQSHGAEMLDLAQHGVASRGAQAAYGLCFYLAKTVLPVRLSPVYLLDPNFDSSQALYVGCALLVLAISVAALAGYRRWPYLTVSWACFVVVVSPVLGIAQTGPQVAADRYTYLSCLPWPLLYAAGLYRLRRAVPSGTAAATGGILVLLGALTFQQTQVWRDSITLWNHALSIDADNPIAYTNRGAAYEGQGELDNALADYLAAITRDPKRADAYFGRGNVRRAKGDLDGARADYDSFVLLRPHDPMGYANRGAVKHLEGKLADAAADYRRALDLAPPDWAFRDTVTANLAEIPGR